MAVAQLVVLVADGKEVVQKEVSQLMSIRYRQTMMDERWEFVWTTADMDDVIDVNIRENAEDGVRRDRHPRNTRGQF